jgi:hypothetical protein
VSDLTQLLRFATSSCCLWSPCIRDARKETGTSFVRLLSGVSPVGKAPFPSHHKPWQAMIGDKLDHGGAFVSHQSCHGVTNPSTRLALLGPIRRLVPRTPVCLGPLAMSWLAGQGKALELLRMAPLSSRSPLILFHWRPRHYADSTSGPTSQAPWLSMKPARLGHRSQSRQGRHHDYLSDQEAKSRAKSPVCPSFSCFSSRVEVKVKPTKQPRTEHKYA